MNSEVMSGPLQDPDPAELGQLTPTVEQVLPAIERLWRYADRDDASGRRPGWLARLDVRLPEAGGGIEAVVADLTEVVIPNGSRISDPGWSGFITTGPTTSAVAAWLAAAAAGGQRYAVQAFNTLERVALGWVAQLCGIPAAYQGVLSSGGSTANLVALGAARQWAFERRGLDVSQDGLPAGVRARVYASEQAAAYLEGAFSSDEQDAVVQFDSVGIAYMDMGVELSAPSRGVLAWAVLRELGRAGVAARVDRHVGFARHVAQRAREHPRLELLLARSFVAWG